MLRLLRLLLIALLAVSLPLKGIAAVAMGACGELDGAALALAAEMDHAAMGHAVPSAQAAHPAHAGHSAHAEPSPQHGDDVADTVPCADTDGHLSDPGDSGDTGKTQCSHCSPCCAAGAPGFATLALAHTETASRTVQTRDRPLPGVTAERLHRPPIVLAG